MEHNNAQGMEMLKYEHAELKKKSQRAFSTIAIAIDTPPLYLVTSYHQPKDDWDALRNHFERETLANKVLLRKKYSNEGGHIN